VREGRPNTDRSVSSTDTYDRPSHAREEVSQEAAWQMLRVNCELVDGDVQMATVA
jgi:hypothetical protein